MNLPASSKESTGYFIPTNDGFTELLNPPSNASFNSIRYSTCRYILQRKIWPLPNILITDYLRTSNPLMA